MRPLRTWPITVLLLILGLSGCKQTDTSVPTRENNLAMGNPSQAGSKDATNYLLDKGMYVLSDNAERGGPNGSKLASLQSLEGISFPLQWQLHSGNGAARWCLSGTLC